MNNAEKLIVCTLIAVASFAFGVHLAPHDEPTAPVVDEAPTESELTMLIREHCGSDERPCEERTQRCFRACDGVGGRMVEMAPTYVAGMVRYDVCVCASPDGIDRYSEDFSRHEHVTTLDCYSEDRE